MAVRVQLTQHSVEDVGRIGQAIYDQCIRPKVMPEHKGEFLVLDINTGEYELDKNDIVATDRIQARLPNGEFYGVRIGYTSAYTLGGQMLEEAA